MIINKPVPVAGDDILVSTGVALTAAFFCNTSKTTDEELTLHLGKSGDPPSDGNKIFNAFKVPADDTLSFDSERLVLDVGDYLFAQSKNGTITATLSVVGL